MEAGFKAFTPNEVFSIPIRPALKLFRLKITSASLVDPHEIRGGVYGVTVQLPRFYIFFQTNPGGSRIVPIIKPGALLPEVVVGTPAFLVGQRLGWWLENIYLRY